MADVTKDFLQETKGKVLDITKALIPLIQKLQIPTVVVGLMANNTVMVAAFHLVDRM
jgi:hypothetical protein